MNTLNGLPVYKMIMNEDDEKSGVEYISLVDFPAIEKNFVAMNAKPMKMYASSTDKQVMIGPAMIPDLPIYRVDKQMGEYYCTFDAVEIENIARRFNREQRTLGINYMHKENSQVSTAVIVEQWFITDKSNDKSNAFGFDLPVGTWMVSVHVADKEFWENEVKSGNVRGFSIEGYLDLEMAKIKKDNTIDMNAIKFEVVKTADGREIYIDGALAVDSYVYSARPDTILIDGKVSKMQYPIWESVLELDTNQILTLSNGKILEIKNKNTDTNMTKIKMNAEIKTANDATLFTPADGFTVDAEVYLVDADGNQTVPEDGDIVLENGTTLVVVAGKITEVKEVAAEMADAEPETESRIIALETAVADLIARVIALETANTEMAKANEVLTVANTEMAAKFASIPGVATTATDKNDTEVSNIKTKMSFEDKVNAVKALIAKK